MAPNPNGFIYGVARDELGNVLPLASVYVYEQGTTTVADLTTSRFVQTAAVNPIITDANGSYQAGIVPGIYNVRIVSESLVFDKTWSDIYVDQVDWAGWDRDGRLMIELENEDGFTLTAAAGAIFAPAGVFTANALWAGGGDFTFTDAGRITYTGTHDRIVKCGLFMQAWWTGENATHHARFHVYLNGADPTNTSGVAMDEDATPIYATGYQPVYMMQRTAYLMETSDYLEIHESGAAADDVDFEHIKFWVE